MSETLACYALTPQGVELARLLAAGLGADVFAPYRLARQGEQGFSGLPALLAEQFHRYQGHIFVTAAGIAVRCIAPHLEKKSCDPAVVVCDQHGRFAVSLVSGHWGGANHLARQVAECLGGTPVITTATDTEELPALDVLAQQTGCAILDWDRIKDINAAVLAGEPVQIYDPFGLLPLEYGTLFTPVRPPRVQIDRPTVSVHWRHVAPADKLLRLAVPALHVGVGCRRGTTSEEILAAVRTTLADAGLEPQAVATLASVTAKQDEQGLLDAAAALHAPVRFYTPEELAEAPAPTPSAMAAQLFGVEHISVCEGAALLAAGGEDALLLAPKTKYAETVTVAVALPESMADEA